MQDRPDPEEYFRSNAIDTDFSRAGPRMRQIELRQQADQMLEEFCTPGGLQGSRLSNEWLGQQGWRVQMVPIVGLQLPDERILRPFLPALRQFKISKILGGIFGSPLRMLSPVWELKWDEDHIDLFLKLHYSSYHMIWCEDRRFAIHGDHGNYDVYAGPEDFVRAALPPHLIGAAATRKNTEEIEWEHGPGCMDAILEHYAPFMLDDD